MANDGFLNLMKIIDGKCKSASHQQKKDSVNYLEITRIIMLCDKTYCHPIHKILRYDFKKEMRKWYKLYDSIIKYTIDHMLNYPLCGFHTEAHIRDAIIFKNRENVLNDAIKNDDWFNQNNTDLSKYFYNIHETIEECVVDLDVRYMILSMIYKEFVDSLFPFKKLQDEMYADDLFCLAANIWKLKSFLKLLGGRIENIYYANIGG